MDITELKRMEREGREQRDALARVNRAASMGQLTASISHELNQPLTGILSNAQAAELMIKQGKIELDEFAAIMTDVVADTKRAGEVIRNLRELYREQKGEFLPVDLNAVVNETAHLLHSEFVMQHVILSTTCASSVPKVDGNRIQIQQVLVNLIMNGIEAMSNTKRDDRQLHIVTAHDADEVKAWVEDCGAGIDVDKIDSIFEPLATWKPGGTGMGLAISNSIVEAHGGRMWAENRTKGGARVGFTLPALIEVEKT
jgi:C4-dicarboxylate-specific signal transduction histidine kinase